MCECVCASSMSAKGQSTTSRHATCMLHEHEHELEAGRYLHPVGAKHQHNRHFRPETATDTETLAHTRGRRASACHRRQGGIPPSGGSSLATAHRTGACSSGVVSTPLPCSHRPTAVITHTPSILASPWSALSNRDKGPVHAQGSFIGPRVGHRAR